MMAKCGMLTAAVALVVCGCLAPGSATASQSAASPSATTITAGFVPNKLGAPSTIELEFHIGRPAGETPPPLLDVDFRLPEGVTLTTSELGLDTCASTTLMSVGSEGCDPDAVMGYGEALIVAPDVAEAILEPVGLTVLMAPPINHHTTLLYYASGDSPVIAQVLFSGQMIGEVAPFGADLQTAIPLTAGLPGEPDTSVVSMRSSIGSKGVTYYKSVHGTRVPYTPKGVVVPSHCPAGGFPFGATFKFADGSTESVSTTSPCPSRRGYARRRRRQSRGGSRG
jgi:hypothetical protein